MQVRITKAASSRFSLIKLQGARSSIYWFPTDHKEYKVSVAFLNSIFLISSQSVPTNFSQVSCNCCSRSPGSPPSGTVEPKCFAANLSRLTKLPNVSASSLFTLICNNSQVNAESEDSGAIDIRL